MKNRALAWRQFLVTGMVLIVVGPSHGQQFSVVAAGATAGGGLVTENITANSGNFADLVTQSLANPGGGAAAAEAAFNANRVWSYQITGFGGNNTFSFGSDDASNTIVFRYPRLGIERQFTGANRSESYQQLLAFLRTLNVTDAAVAGPRAASNPVAGNPGSLSAMLSRQGFAAGVGGTGTGGGSGGALGGVGNISGVGSGYMSLRQGSSTTRVLEVPLSWAIRSEVDPRRMLLISVPLAQADIDGVKVNYYGIGAGLRLPVTQSWSLTPALQYGGMNASALNVKSEVVNVSLTSAYGIDLGEGSRMLIGNMLGYYRSLNYTSFGAGNDAAIANTVLKNGVLFSRPAALRNMKFAVELSLTDTRIAGTETYNKGYTELGVALATRYSEGMQDAVRFGATYLYSGTSKGFGVNFGYWF